MFIKIIKYSCIIFIVLLNVKCTSVAKYNQKISQPIPVEKLQKDVNFVQNKLEKLHPSLYWYISKEQLNSKFDSIRKVINKPMTSKEFYFLISPVVASVHQGHMTMTPAIKRVNKKEQKRLKKAGDGPLSQFSFDWFNEKLFVIKNKSKDNSIKAGAEIVSINGILPQDIYSKYRKSYTSDGLNKTYLRKGFAKRFTLYMTNEIGINDSLTYVFKQGDSIFNKIISRNKSIKKSVVKKKVIDSTMVKTVAKNSIDKEKVKAEKKRKKIFGYDVLSKDYSKSLKIMESDSTVAVLRLKNFSKGRFGSAYKMIFDSIKNNKISTLIIDLSDNPGGKVNDVQCLYSYLTDKDFNMFQPSIVTSKTSLWHSGFFRQIPKITYPIAGVMYPFYMGFTYFRTKKLTDGTYVYNLNGGKKIKSKPNHFNGKIYVIINGGSFSASCLLSSMLKTNPKVTFVGEETGGTFNGTVAGIMPVFELPSSKILFRLGLMDIRPNNETDVFGRGIFPDIEITPTLQDRINNKEVEMEWILNDSKVNK